VERNQEIDIPEEIAMGNSNPFKTGGVEAMY